MPPFQRLDSKKRLSAREEDARRSRDRESCEIEGHTFFCRCKEFPGSRTKFPRHTHLARPLTIHHATNRSDQQARPAPAPHKTPSTARQSVVFAFQPAFRESIWVLVSARGRCSHALVGCVAPWSSVICVTRRSHDAPPRSTRVWACLTMSFFGGRRPSNVLLHTQGPRTRACS